MAKSDKRIGDCLCGALKIAVPFERNDVGVCFCSKCKKWSGGPLMELECGKDLEISGAENLMIFSSSSWAERAFCQICGSHIYIKDIRTGEYGVPPGLFNDDEALELNRQVFSDKKPTFYAFSNKTQNITSAFIHEHYPETKENT